MAGFTIANWLPATFPPLPQSHSSTRPPSQLTTGVAMLRGLMTLPEAPIRNDDHVF